jgi:hypothetical protein
MPSESFTIGIIVERRQSSNLWVQASWLPVGILPGVPAAAPWTKIDERESVVSFYAGSAEIVLYSTEAANYRDNLASGQPRIWIALRETSGAEPIEIAGVTADPAEGEAMTEAGNDIVEAVPMPPEIAATVTAFVAQHHVERGFFKRMRNKANSEALAARPALMPESCEKADGDD